MTTVTVSEASFAVVAAPGTLGRPALTSTIIILTSVAAQRGFPGCVSVAETQNVVDHAFEFVDVRHSDVAQTLF
ncbi:hypothetical protein PF005_g26270 [Phytophthora fragariae]|uniref:Uncharacterized protein n=1 Tax=Phytophthora fragariae TaxID=53985 RepID=A0A6A4BSI0_9STRA|nr:hypothetical protein PF009_g27745 [Phytophthora fragariae]KAE9084656.1 hypothetical protein PF007_g21438 [Phytophthora fragariae]KAE9087538.1 hypothetical protein PF006_g25781 [Phytophthora fragariae]KAE9173437.1 hypothetical protein PF005_g26270 [Phytophthora fragariae]KAE9178155.1 hypothetical protein PF002_g28146 [Phytophthora fragariae]